MSNFEFDPNADTPKIPDWQRDPTTGGYVAPTPPGVEVMRDWEHLRGIMSGIEASNAAIASQTKDLTSVLKQHVDAMERINTYTDRQVRQTKELHKESRGRLGVEEQIAASQQELLRQRNESEQRQVVIRQNAQRIEEEFANFRQADLAKQMDMLREYGFVTPRGQVTLGGQAYPSGAISSALAKVNPTEQEQQLRDLVEHQVGQAITNKALQGSARRVETILDAAEEAGIQQLRYGQLPIQDILRAAGTLAGRRYTERTALPNIPGLAGGAEGAAAGAGRGIIPLGLLASASRFLPVLGQGIAISDILGRTVSNMYGRTAGAFYQAPIRAGQLTGEGWTAGIQSSFNALRLGANPFDLISMRQAGEIVQATRTRGFTGGRGYDVMQGIASVVNDLGIEINQAADFFTDAMRRGGLSVNEVRKQMENFDTSAHALNMNINDYTQTVLQNTQSLRSMGFGAAAPGIARTLTAAVPAGYRGGTGEQALTQFFTAAKGEIAARLGGGANILNVTSARYGTRSMQELDNIMEEQIRFAISSLPADQHTPNDIANYLAQVGPYTQGMDPGFLAQYIMSLRSGRGVGAQQTFRRAEQTWASQLTADRMKNARVQQLSSMSADQLGHLGITTRRVFRGGRAGGFVTEYRDRQGNKLSPTAYRRSLGHYDRDTITQMRQSLISSLGPYLTSQERDRIESASPMDVISELRNISEQRGPLRGTTVRSGNVTISLKSGIESRLFELTAAQNEAVSRGTTPPNTLRRHR